MASTLATTSSRIENTFARLKEDRKKALVCYVTAGHPDLPESRELLTALQESGADVIEVGVPFSDPIADGPVIQESSQIALGKGMTLDKTLELISDTKLEVPVVLFTYLNPLMASGKDVLDRARQAGVGGVLLTDLPVGADDRIERWLGDSDLDFIRLVAPTTPSDRMKEIARNGSGFVYLISRLGVTGASASVSADLPQTVSRLREVTDLPICVGFGVSTGDQARTAAEFADGVVVGSALVRLAGESVGKAARFTASLRSALDS
jgi:tryptophan synthase alpha chain